MSLSFKPCIWGVDAYKNFFYSCHKGYDSCENPEYIFDDEATTKEKVKAYYDFNAYILSNGNVYGCNSVDSKCYFLTTINNERKILHPSSPHHRYYCKACFFASNAELKQRTYYDFIARKEGRAPLL